MEELNKTQLILLALLVSFVTSIATGIVTVTLLDQAPKGVTRTINRVVERTVETVVPGETKIIEKIREVASGPTEEELVVAAIAKVEPALVRLALAGDFSTTSPAETKIQSAFLISGDGHIATLSSSLKLETDYLIKLSDGSTGTARVIIIDSHDGFAILKINQERGGEKPNSALEAIAESFRKSSFFYLDPAKGNISLGQTVISVGVGGSLGKNVTLGIISGIRTESGSTTPLYHTTVEADADNLGGPLMNLKGELIGLLSGDESAAVGSKSVAVPAVTISKALAALASQVVVQNSQIAGEAAISVDSASPAE